MTFEVLLLAFAIILLVFDLFQLSRTKQKSKLSQGLLASAVAFLLILATYGLLVGAFVVGDYSLQEVYNYSSSSLSFVNKICASWAGAGGSILFLSLLIVSIYFAYRVKVNKNVTAKGLASAQIFNILVIFFVLMDIGKNAFTRFDTVPPDGLGLNPALQSPWMVMHPPIVFAGYAFVLLAFALVLGGMKSREYGEERILRVSIGVAWLFLTVGIAMGGVWAYEVLGWGGYWSWDPVETGSLLVWLALTAYFFVRPLAQNGKSMARQFTVLVAFAALIFLSALTRGGLLRSVHAYALSPAGPILIALAFGFGAYFFYLQRKARTPLLKLDINRSQVKSISIALGYFSLAALFFGSFMGVAVPILEQLFTSEPLTPGTSFYNSWSFPFAALLLISIVGYTLRDKLTTKMFGLFAAGTLVAGAILVVAVLPTGDFLANMGLPLLFVSLCCVLYDLVRTAVESKRTLKSFGRKILFLGMILGLFGILFSAATKQTASSQTVVFNTNGVATIQVLGISIVMRDWEAYSGEGQAYSPDLDSLVPERSSLKVNLEVYRGGGVYSASAWTYLYTNYGTVAQPLLIHTLQGDIYLHLEVTDEVYDALLQALMGLSASAPQEVLLTVSSVPMVYLLWFGVGLMCAGVTLNAIADSRKPDEKWREDFL